MRPKIQKLTDRTFEFSGLDGETRIILADTQTEAMRLLLDTYGISVRELEGREIPNRRGTLALRIGFFVERQLRALRRQLGFVEIVRVKQPTPVELSRRVAR